MSSQVHQKSPYKSSVSEQKEQKLLVYFKKTLENLTTSLFYAYPVTFDHLPVDLRALPVNLGWHPLNFPLFCLIFGHFRLFFSHFRLMSDYFRSVFYHFRLVFGKKQFWRWCFTSWHLPKWIIRGEGDSFNTGHM